MNCKNYMASATNILVGRAKWKKALVNIVEGIECNWQIPDSMAIIEPSHFELEILKETGETLL
jgi:predicted component of type VI protein secretion system